MSDLRVSENNEIEFPRQYEYIDGGEIRQDWAGQRTPIPPKWVRDWVKLPDYLKHATLSRELSDIYPIRVRSALVDYVKKWPENRKYGTNLVIGGRGGHVRRNWCAAAVLNEITMRYGQIMDVSSAWLYGNHVASLLEARDRHSEVFASMRNRFQRAKLAVIENPLRIPPSDQNIRWFLENVYEQRQASQLPTITTLRADLSDEDWGPVENILGPWITEYLQNVPSGYIITW